MPHVGTKIPSTVLPRLTDAAKRLPDTDWHVDTLYAFAKDLGASMIAPKYSRTLVDLNRDPDGVPLYPGANNTELCPTTMFSGEAIYRENMAPDADEVESRKIEYYWPYHHALRRELDRIRKTFGIAVLYDAHSIRSRVPRFFDGVLPDFNLGTAKGTTASDILVRGVTEVLAKETTYTWVLNGRFQGGYITRHYGDPAADIHSLQMELTQKNYMDEDDPFPYRKDLAEAFQKPLRNVLLAVLGFLQERAPGLGKPKE
jgi:N-formylglutamate amidohydrolase